MNNEAKAVIARAAVELIADGATVYLDYTTSYAIAAEIVRQQKRATVITPTLPIANILPESTEVDTVVLGGIMRRNECSLFGPLAERALEGATSSKAMDHCTTVVLVADADKLDTIAVNRISELESIDVVITDGTPSPELSVAIDGADITLTTTKE
ncbi:MAG: hypothetical protein IPJ61_17350 [Tessaracoccus sp.]|uniref:hypothetical protein n=1 Tax=Tessaracoccus sp. TaxID=1971211 RepID=UPI001EC0714D|nr:hypothetical protein [Tessaracoccus sp.]MBK7822777.1 hypothetical protein [Tessaracoccus sp.]